MRIRLFLMLFLMIGMVKNAFSMPLFIYEFTFGENDQRPKGDKVTYSSDIGSEFKFFRLRDFNDDGLADLIGFELSGPAKLSWLDTRDISSTLEFSTSRMNNVNLEEGNYNNAQGSLLADPGRPGIDYSFNSIGPNTVRGNFKILESNIINGPRQRDNDGYKVVSFAATFNANQRQGFIYYNYEPPVSPITSPILPTVPRSPTVPKSPTPPNLNSLFGPKAPTVPTPPASPAFYLASDLEVDQHVATIINPEPASMLLFGTGLVGLLGRRRKYLLLKSTS